ncbi:MAG: DUF3631 domain-containing protein [Gemmatimonadota bacterium]
MSAEALEFLHKAGTWTWANGDHEVEATDARMPGGEVRAVVTVRRAGALVHRSGLKLTSDRERERFLGKVENAGGELPGPILLALEEQIRRNPPHADAVESSGAGSRIALEDPEPWPEPVSGADLLDGLLGTFCRFLGLPEWAPVALALWTLHAHAHDASDVSPLLALVSPEKRCGKTTALHVLWALVPRPLPASNVTAAALFRAVERFRPTLLVDEADTFLRDREELRGVLNSGHARASAVVVRTVGDDHEARAFSTWAPKAVALIGDLPDTLADRSIIIPMRRRHPDEDVERLRLDRLAELEPLRRRAWTWAKDHADALRSADPEVPGDLHDRAADNWRPLLALADHAGGGWPERARQAARGLAGLDDGDDGSVRTLLLRDLRDLFDDRNVDRLPSQEIADQLETMEGRPWGEWGRSRKPITPHALARLLKPFGVRPKVVKMPDGSTPRGYLREELVEPWGRYLPREGGDRVQPLQPSSNDGETPDWHDRNPQGSVALPESTGNPHESKKVAGVAFPDPPPEGEEPPADLWHGTPDLEPGEIPAPTSTDAHPDDDREEVPL